MSLSATQLRVLRMVARGMMDKQIAYEIDCCSTTVKAHIGAVREKITRQGKGSGGIARGHWPHGRVPLCLWYLAHCPPGERDDIIHGRST